MRKLQSVSSLMEEIAYIFFRFSLIEKSDDV